MKLSLIFASVIGLAAAPMASADIINADFEQGLSGWSVKEDGNAVSESSDARSGEGSAKISGKSGVMEQHVTVTANTHYNLKSYIKGAGLLGVKVGSKIYFDRMAKNKKWDDLTIKFNTDGETQITIFASYNGAQGRYDDMSLKAKGAQGSQKLSPNVVSKSSGGSGLSPNLAPSENFDLTRWYLSVPTDTDNNGRPDSIYEAALNKGYQDPNYFYTAPDGGMVFKVPVSGFKTSTNTSYTRTELREMLRRGDKSISNSNSNGQPNKNNWVFSSAPSKAQKNAGAVDGVLEATLAVNHVTTTGKAHEIGRVIVGQIHGKDDEPIRLYYRKQPHHERGVIYAAHETQAQEKDVYFEMIGSRANSAPDPVNGFALDEKFSYKIDARGNALYVTISDVLGNVRAQQTIDMTNSGYDVANDYMYFKAGVYNQNKTGEPDDYVQATFYRLKVTH